LWDYSFAVVFVGLYIVVVADARNVALVYYVLSAVVKLPVEENSCNYFIDR